MSGNSISLLDHIFLLFSCLKKFWESEYMFLFRPAGKLSKKVQNIGQDEKDLEGILGADSEAGRRNII